MEVLPLSIGNLYNLETLLLPFKPIRLPQEIWRLHRLKHLEAFYCEFEGEPRVYYLKSLYTLKLGVGNWIEEEKTFNSLGNLRNLGIGLRYRSDSMEQIGSFICKLVNLQSFEFWGNMKGESAYQGILNLEGHFHLSKMFSRVKLERAPKFPQTLTKLSLRFSEFNEDPMPTLEKLTNLRSLSLESDAYTGKKMISSAHGFPQLKYLQFLFLGRLEEWTVEQGAMPKLEILKISYCLMLDKLSESLRCMTTLKIVRIHHPSYGLKNWLKNAEEEGWFKNQHLATSPVHVIQY